VAELSPIPAVAGPQHVGESPECEVVQFAEGFLRTCWESDSACLRD